MDARTRTQQIKTNIISKYYNTDIDINDDTDYEKVKFLINPKYKFLTKDQIDKLNIKLVRYESNKNSKRIAEYIQKNNDTDTAGDLKYLKDLQYAEETTQKPTTFKELLTGAMNEGQKEGILMPIYEEKEEESTPAGEKEKDNEFIQETGVQELIDKQLPSYEEGRGNEYYRMLYIDAHASEMDSTEEHKSDEVVSKSKGGKTQKKKKNLGKSRAKQRTIKNKVSY